MVPPGTSVVGSVRTPGAYWRKACRSCVVCQKRLLIARTSSSVRRKSWSITTPPRPDEVFMHRRMAWAMSGWPKSAPSTFADVRFHPPRLLLYMRCVLVVGRSCALLPQAVAPRRCFQYPVPSCSSSGSLSSVSELLHCSNLAAWSCAGAAVSGLSLCVWSAVTASAWLPEPATGGASPPQCSPGVLVRLSLLPAGCHRSGARLLRLGLVAC